MLERIRQRMHRQIRREQIEFKFKNNRQMLSLVSSQDAKQVLRQNLRVVKLEMEEPRNVCDLISSLCKIQNLLNRYNLISQLSKTVQLSSDSERVKSHVVPFQCTWINLFLIMMQQSQDETVLQSCCCILSNTAYCLNDAMGQGHMQNPRGLVYIQQYRLMLEQYPYTRLKQTSCKIVEYSLSLTYYVITGWKDGTGIYYLLNRISPNILQLLSEVNSNQNILNIQQIRDQFIQTTASILILIQKSDLNHVQAQSCERLLEIVTGIVFESITNTTDRQLFSKSAKIMKILCAIKSFRLSQQKFMILEQLFRRQHSESNQEYFEMMKKMLQRHEYQLSSDTVELLLLKLLALEPSYQKSESFLPHYIVHILRNHIINCGNRMRPEDMQSYLTILKSNSEELGRVGAFLQRTQMRSFKCLLQILVHLVMDDMQNGSYLLENQLRVLIEYDEFRKMLSQIGVQIETVSPV